MVRGVLNPMSRKNEKEYGPLTETVTSFCPVLGLTVGPEQVAVKLLNRGVMWTLFSAVVLPLGVPVQGLVCRVAARRAPSRAAFWAMWTAKRARPKSEAPPTRTSRKGRSNVNSTKLWPVGFLSRERIVRIALQSPSCTGQQTHHEPAGQDAAASTLNPASLRKDPGCLRS